VSYVLLPVPKYAVHYSSAVLHRSTGTVSACRTTTGTVLVRRTHCVHRSSWLFQLFHELC